MKHLKLTVATLALLLAVVLLPEWSHAAELAGPTTPAAPASCPASSSLLAPLPHPAPWSAPLALDTAVCGLCGDPVCQGQAFYSVCGPATAPPSPILVCWPKLYCASGVLGGGRECLCQPEPS